jgi:hypothetical protein
MMSPRGSRHRDGVAFHEKRCLLEKSFAGSGGPSVVNELS